MSFPHRNNATAKAVPRHPKPSYPEPVVDWHNLCDASQCLAWCKWYRDQWRQGKPPPRGWSDNQVIDFVATLLNERKSDALRAAVMMLIYEDVKAIIRSERGK